MCNNLILLITCEAKLTIINHFNYFMNLIVIYIYIIKEKDNKMSIVPKAKCLTSSTFAGFLVILSLQLWP